jgi:hypothetical protein
MALMSFLSLFPAAAFAQTAGQMDILLETPRVTCAQAAALVLPAAGLLEPEAGQDAAFGRAREWLPRAAVMNAPIRMGELSHLVMGAFGLSGGFMYALFPGPRYAYRALAWRRVLPLRPDPRRTVSGAELLYITGQVLSLTGETGLVSITTERGEGFSSGSEDLTPYEGGFELE